MIDWGTVIISALLGSLGGYILSLYAMYRFIDGFRKEYEKLTSCSEKGEVKKNE